MTPDETVLEWAEHHHGVITRETARTAGLTDRQIQRRVSTGRWTPIRPGVWSPAGLPPSPMLDTAAAAFWTGGAVSHASAAWLHELVEDAPGVPELTVGSRAGCRSEGVRLHRTTDLLRRDTMTVKGLRTTNPIRTCIDMGARFGADDLERLIERARHRRLVHLSPLITRFLQLARPGRDGIAVVRVVLQAMDPALEPAESDLETLLMRLLVDGGLPGPVRQHPVSIDGRRFRIDVCYPDRKLAIESDGFTDHGLRSAFEDDRERQNLLALDGWTVLRFTWRHICARPEWVVDQVRHALDRCPGNGPA